MTFVDSSGYAKLFLAETGTAEIIDFFLQSPLHSISVSQIAEVEVRSAIRRRELAGYLTAAEATKTIARFTSHSRLLRQQKISEGVVTIAARIVDRHGLRTLDSIQLACAILVLQQAAPESVRFVASDLKLLRAAAAEGFLVWNPEDGPCLP